MEKNIEKLNKERENIEIDEIVRDWCSIGRLPPIKSYARERIVRLLNNRENDVLLRIKSN